MLSEGSDPANPPKQTFELIYKKTLVGKIGPRALGPSRDLCVRLGVRLGSRKGRLSPPTLPWLRPCCQLISAIRNAFCTSYPEIPIRRLELH